MTTVLVFGPLREALGKSSLSIDAASVAEIFPALIEAGGEEVATLLAHCRVWVNGDEATTMLHLGPNDEVAVIPPVAGG
jgi:molybdopterin converting factor small subunit